MTEPTEAAPRPITAAQADAAFVAYNESISGPGDPAVIAAMKNPGPWRRHWIAALEAARSVGEDGQ